MLHIKFHRIILYLCFVLAICIGRGFTVAAGNEKTTLSLNDKMYKCFLESDQFGMLKLLKQGANIDYTPSNELPMLFWAVSHDDFGMVDFLLKNGADPKILDSTGGNLLSGVCSVKMAQLLIDRGVSRSHRDSQGYIPLHRAYNAEPELIKLLAVPRELVNAVSDTGKTPLMSICSASRNDSGFDAAKTLLVLGADCKFIGRGGMTALMFASASLNPRLIALLLDSGAEIDRQDLDGNTALHFAAIKPCDGNIKLLLRRGANGMLRNYAGRFFYQMP